MLAEPKLCIVLAVDFGFYIVLIAGYHRHTLTQIGRWGGRSPQRLLLPLY